jgi:hypothetical protein
VRTLAGRFRHGRHLPSVPAAVLVSEQTFADGQRQDADIGGVSTGTWSCRGANMTVTATLGSGLPDAVLTLSRTAG